MGVREPASGLHQRPAEPVVGAQTSLIPSLVQTVDGVHFAKTPVEKFSMKWILAFFNQIGRVYFFFFLFFKFEVSPAAASGWSLLCVHFSQ